MRPDPRFVERWCRFFEAVAPVHDYRCAGLEHIPEGACMLAGYHGRPAMDFFFLAALMWRRLGRWPRGVAHRALLGAPGLGRALRRLGMVGGDPGEIDEVQSSGEVLVSLPGGSRECFRSSRVRYRVDWGGHRGYARLAIRRRLPVLPVASSGVDDLYRVIGDGHRISMRLTGTDLFPLCLPLGHRGLPFPFPPRPVAIHQHIGAPLQPPAGTADLDAFDALVRARVQELLDLAVARPLAPGEGATLG